VAVGDIDVVVVVDRGGADVPVELAFDVPGAAAVRGLFRGEVDFGKLDDNLWDLVGRARMGLKVYGLVWSEYGPVSRFPRTFRVG
jgi:hypothetical protein